MYAIETMEEATFIHLSSLGITVTEMTLGGSTILSSTNQNSTL